MSRPPDPSNPLPSPRTGDGRFAKGNPGGPGRPLDIDVPAVAKVFDLSAAAARVADAVLQGELTPREGQEVSSLFQMQCRVLDTNELEARLREIEEQYRQLEEKKKGRETDRY